MLGFSGQHVWREPQHYRPILAILNPVLSLGRVVYSIMTPHHDVNEGVLDHNPSSGHQRVEAYSKLTFGNLDNIGSHSH
ncbi:hypothetical protein LshimejAT787_1702260 [Lyophyllum shimeji]|uniref:Uncharacterized protein n=1 Tax=Lyophyllum shimeji TaxID=47721 RepID=A0A9P3PZS3_LYOSH|nr:hypothetical protein LshimejAT787_1702260 [Lyophyllum shimeji]